MKTLNLNDAYSTDGGKTWRWKSNDNYVPLDAAREYGIPVDVAAQTVARDRQVAEQCAEYRKAQRGRRVTAEERYEMRAAFGPGVTVVNVLTGRKTRTGGRRAR